MADTTVGLLLLLRWYLSNGRAIGMVVIRPSIRLSRISCGYSFKS